jgi:spore maturation protein CgeB
MRILVVGDGHSTIHERAIVKAFNKLGYKTKYFYWYKYFYSSNPIKNFCSRIQNKFILGPIIEKINQDFYKLAINFKPQLIFIYRGTHIIPRAIEAIKLKIPNCKVFGYNNDNPFSTGHPFWLWRYFIKCLPIYDLVFAYRLKNLKDFKKKKARHVALLRSWFDPEKNFAVNLSNKDQINYSSDVVFVGHFESDGRLEYLEEVVKAGYSLKIFGPPYEWNKIILKSKHLKHLYPVNLVWNINYNKAISGAKIALCFFSKLNDDSYTRRCFEIPAIGTMLFSEYSKDMCSLFDKGIEVDLFKSKKEFINKIKYYLENNSIRKKIANRGRKKVFSAHHDVFSRAKTIVSYYINNFK